MRVCTPHLEEILLSGQETWKTSSIISQRVEKVAPYFYPTSLPACLSLEAAIVTDQQGGSNEGKRQLVVPKVLGGGGGAS